MKSDGGEVDVKTDLKAISDASPDDDLKRIENVLDQTEDVSAAKE